MFLTCPRSHDSIIYSYSNLTHISYAVFSLEISFNTLSLRHKIMVLLNLSTILVFYACVRHTNFKVPHFNAFTFFCWIKTACVFTFHKLNLLSLENFLVSHLELTMFPHKLRLFVRETTCCVIMYKYSNTPRK